MIPVRQVNGVDFRGISHQRAVTVLKRCSSTADIVCQYLPEGTVCVLLRRIYTGKSFSGHFFQDFYD